MYKFLFVLILGLCVLSGCVLFSTHTDVNNELIKDTRIQEVRYRDWIWRCFDPAPDLLIMIGTTLYVNQDCWDNIDPQDEWAKAMLVHEETHLIRQQQAGLMCWLWDYIFDADFRWQEESTAYTAAWEYSMWQGRTYTMADCRSFGEYLSNISYLSVTKEKATEFVISTIMLCKFKMAIYKYFNFQWSEPYVIRVFNIKGL